MSEQPGFAGLVPGFDFLQGLMRNAGQALPGVGQWVAPTLDPAELDKRISELRTVQFWLEQNAHMLSATIQALEVQRMTLNTLRTMNVSLGDLRDAMTLKMPTSPSPSAPAAAPTASPSPSPFMFSRPPKEADVSAPAEGKPGDATASVLSGVVDPMLWWGALTRQFGELAAHAIKESAQAGVAAATVTPTPGPAPGGPRPTAGSAGLTGSETAAGVQPATRSNAATSGASARVPTAPAMPVRKTVGKAASVATAPRASAPSVRKKPGGAA